MRGWRWIVGLGFFALVAMLVMRGLGPLWVQAVVAVCVHLGVWAALFVLIYTAGGKALQFLRGMFRSGQGPVGAECNAALYILDLAEVGLKWFLLGLFAITVLGACGVSVGPMLCGLGLAALPITLGAQNIFKNLISGVLFVFGRRALVGDRILAGGCDGVLEQVGAQGLTLRQKDGSLVFMPFAQIGSVVNYNSGYTIALLEWVFPSHFSVAQIQSAVDQAFAALAHAGARADYSAEQPVVHLRGATADGMNVIIRVRTRTDPLHTFDPIMLAAIAEQVKQIEAKSASR